MAKRGNYNITPYDIEQMSDEEVKKAYQHYRYVANKRLVRLKRAGFTDYEAYKQYKGKFKESATQLTPRQQRNRLAKAGAFLRMFGSTVREVQGYENRMIKQLHEKGYTFVNKKNLPQFGRYMDKVRDKWGSKAFDSDRAASMFEYYERINKKRIDIDTFVDNLDKFMDAEEELNNSVDNMIETAVRQGKSQRTINKLIGSRKRRTTKRMMEVAGGIEGAETWEEKEGVQRAKRKPRSRRRKR